MTDLLQKALTTVELREAQLLAWGAVGAEWLRHELVAILDLYGNGEELLAEMLDSALIVETPTGGYRSRSAETIRILACLRQAFRQEAMLSGRPLVLDYRYLQRPRRRPIRDVSVETLEATVRGTLGSAGLEALRVLTPPTVSQFQMRSTERILRALDSENGAGIMVTAGTGSGKTLAFYLPTLAWVCERPGDKGVQALALYPRNELLKDQLRALVGFGLELRGLGGYSFPVSLATWFGLTPFSASALRDGRFAGWRKVSGGYVCPFLRCPAADCDDGDLIWPNAELKAGTELLRCSKCGSEVPGDLLRLTRESARRNPPRVMLSTTESLNRQLSSPGNLAAFGIQANGLRAVLLDEVHTYMGTTGAQNAYLFRRLNAALGYQPVWAGLSATLADAGDFFARLVNLDPGFVEVIEPQTSELEESGAEYLLALRHNPHGNTGTLSTTIQAAMALSRALDPMTGNPFSPPVDSGGVFGKRLFAFTDKLDSTNRLYWDLLDAEGWAWPGEPKRGTSPLTLAHLRSHDQGRMSASQAEAPEIRDADGQYWWLAEQLGHEIDGDVQKRVGRTSSQDSGVSADADIVVATASLEVGFDDDRVGAVLQHKAPHDAAQFLQRKGRAGRASHTRPWTAVVLSDWGRDRDAWDAYDALFSPLVPARNLPLENLYVLRIQAVYCLLDWLARELHYTSASTWGVAAGPADLLESDSKWRMQTEARQHDMASLLTSLLREGAERASLIRHLRRSLSLGYGPVSDTTLDKILWEAPRPLLAVVVPTLRRRLIDQWRAERPTSDDTGILTRTPLRDFVPGNLFDELLVPEVECQVPWARGEIHVEQLPALRVIREFLPGNVSRHFGVWATNKRHWVPLPDEREVDGSHVVDVSLYGGAVIDDVVGDHGAIRVYAPSKVALASVPESVSDASSMRAHWGFRATPLGAGTTLPTAGLSGRIFLSLSAHLHSQGGGVRIVRYAESGRGSIWERGQATPSRIRFRDRRGNAWGRAALGVEIYADALRGHVETPQFETDPSPAERTDWVRELISRDHELPDELMAFDRTSIADAAVAFAVSWHWYSGDPDPVQFASGIRRSAVIMGLYDPARPSVRAAWLDDAGVLSRIRTHVLAARSSTRSGDWVAWMERRFTLGAAQALLLALAGGNTHVDVDDLLIDLDDSDPKKFYVSEQSPGGTGQIEALTVDLIEAPERLPLTLTDVLRPNDIELLDVQLRAVIDSDEEQVRLSLQALAQSWAEGHESVRVATDRLDQAISSASLDLAHPAKVAISTRLAGPGASSQLLDELGEWMRIRDVAQEASGFAVDPRSLATLLSSRTEVDVHLHIAEADEVKRARAIANLLWPWGRFSRPHESFNPYSGQGSGTIELLREHWKSPIAVIEVGYWDESQRDKVHTTLRNQGELVIRVPTSGAKTLRSVLIDLQSIPVEVGPLWCYPEVLGLHNSGTASEARLVLRETW